MISLNKLTDIYKLNNGVEIPCIGFGTWQSTGEEAYNAVLQALKAGYRHIDTAAVYNNEEMVGKAIKDSGVKREDIFLTTKLWNDVRGYEDTKAACLESMKKLGVDYLDLYLIHWPNPIKYREHHLDLNVESYRAMEDLMKEGKIRAIGVSNFLIHHLEDLISRVSIKPQVNQIKLHPGLIQKEVIEYCKKQNILLEAYSPLGTGKIFEVEELAQIAAKYNKSIAQVCIRYSLQKGFLPLPKSTHENRIIENANVFDFNLTDEDMTLIDNLPNYLAPLKDIDNINY